jgi:hypothetical protein
MDVIPKIMLYMIGTFLNFRDLTRLSLTSKQMNQRTEEPKKLLAKREVMRLFSSDLSNFRMIIHSVSYEMGPVDYSTPTLKDGFNWLSILKDGLTMRMKWPKNIGDSLFAISKILKHPENNLPSFHRNSFSNLETSTQENLFEILGSSMSRKLEMGSPGIEVDLDSFDRLENIYLLYAYFYKHNSNVIQESPKISDISKFHSCLISVVSHA